MMLSLLPAALVKFAHEDLLPEEAAPLVNMERMPYGLSIEVTCFRCRFIFDVLTRDLFDGRYDSQPDRHGVPGLKGDR